MVGGKTGVDDAQEGGGHVGLDRLVEGRVEPSYRPLPASPSRLACSFFHSWWGVRELVFVVVVSKLNHQCMCSKLQGGTSANSGRGA